MTAAKKAAPAAKKTATAKKAVTAKPTGKVELDTSAPVIPDPLYSVTPDVKRSVEKTESANKAEVGSPAWRRANDLAALEQELDMCERSGKTDRVAAIKDAIRVAKSTVTGRSSGTKDEA
jgi:hypothetical protein